MNKNVTQTDYDPVLLEVIRNAVKATAEEMGVTLTKTAFSTNIKDRKDLSCAVYTPDGDLIAQAEHIPVHLGMMPSAVKEGMKRLDSVNPGDSIIQNDPYVSGTHLPDVMVFTPVFHEGEQVAVVGSLAHHVDVGGATPGSMSTQVTSMVQEGLRIPPIKIARNGEIDKDLVNLLLSNLRTSEVSEGDLSAQFAANQIGKDNITQIIEKYGVDTFTEYLHKIMDYSESRMRGSIRELNDGVGEFTDYIEGDGVNSSEEDFPIHTKVEIRDDEIHVDFSGTTDQADGPINAVYPHALSCVYFVAKAIVDPQSPTNMGTYRPINVEAPEGSLVNARYPGPTGNSNLITCQRMVDTLLGAFREIVPDRVMTASTGTMNGLVIGGNKIDSDEIYSYVETYGGGMGSKYNLDGMDGVHTNMTNTRNAPVEVLENTYPFTVNRYELVENSEGPGEYRGGMGLTREIRIENDATVTVISDRKRNQPWGVDGGHSAGGTSIKLSGSDGTVEDLETKCVVDVEGGSTFSFQTAGGGGWGAPTERDPDAVARDVRNNLISEQRARDIYGVVVEDDVLNVEATRKLRTDMA